MLVKILNKLLEYSNKYIVVKYDFNLQIPAFSFIDTDINDRFVPTIVLNPNNYPQDENVIAHILGHEWGHHVLGHIKVPTDINRDYNESHILRDKKEDEADAYAAGFIKEFFYNKKPIIDFINNTSPYPSKRISILEI